MSKELEINVRAKAYGMEEFTSYGAAIRHLGQEVSDASQKLAKIDAYKALKTELAESEAVMKRTQQEVLALGGALSRTEQPTHQMRVEFNQAVLTAEKAERAFFANKEKLAALGVELQQAGVNTGRLTIEQRDLNQAFEQSKAALEQNQRQVQAYGTLGMKSFADINAQIRDQKAAYQQLKESGKLSVLELSKAKQQLNDNIRQLRSETNGWTGALSKARMGLVALGGAVFVGRDLAASFMEYEKKMDEVNTLVEMSAERHAKLKDEISDLSRQYPVAAGDLASATYDIVSAGVGLEDSTRVLELSAKAAIAGVTDTKTAVNLGVGAMNAYGKSVNDLSGIYDIMFAAVKAGVTTFPELAQSMGGVMPIAKAANVDLADTAAAIAAMTKAGLKTPEASTALKGAIIAMSTPTADAKKQFDALGITWQGLLPTLEQIREKNLSIDQMRKLIPDVQARTGVLSLLNSFDSLKTILTDTNDAAGSTQAAFEKMKDTPANQLITFNNAIAALKRDLGELIVDAVLPVTKSLSGFIGYLLDADPAVQMVARTAGGVAVALVLWNTGLGHIVTGTKLMLLHNYDAVASIKTLSLSTLTLKSGLTAATGALTAFIAGWQIGRIISAWDFFGVLDMSIGHYVQLFIAKIDKLFATVMLKYANFKKSVYDLLPGFDALADKQQKVIDKYQKKISIIDATIEKIHEEGRAGKGAADDATAAVDDMAAAAADAAKILARSFDHVQDELDNVTDAANDAANTTNKIGDRADDVGDDFSKAKNRVNEFGRSLAAASTQASGLAGEVDGVAEAAAKAREELDKLEGKEEDKEEEVNRSGGRMLDNYLELDKAFIAATNSAESFHDLEMALIKDANHLGAGYELIRWQAKETLEQLRILKRVWEGEEIGKLNVMDMDVVTYEAALEITKKLQPDDSKTYATGGLIGGRRHDQGGTIIEAEAGEYVHPRAAVDYYGMGFMEAIRRRILPRFGLGGIVQQIGLPRLSLPAIPDIPPRKYETGGMVSGAPSRTVRVEFDMGASGRAVGTFAEAEANKFLTTLARAKRISCLEA